jgi:hypothetical protein
MDITDPAALVDSLSPDQLRARLKELDRQMRATKILLRAAIARERRASLVTEPKEVSHAS